MLHMPDESIVALVWNDTGTRLGWGDEDGGVGYVDLVAQQ